MSQVSPLDYVNDKHVDLRQPKVDECVKEAGDVAFDKNKRMILRILCDEWDKNLRDAPLPLRHK
jgi:hypothetical protein